MKNLLPITVVGICLLQPLVESFFLGPIAVGVGVGILALGKGLFLGGLLSRRRSRGTRYTTYKRSSYNYEPSNHYNYGSHHAKPRTTYYYSSKKYPRSRRVKTVRGKTNQPTNRPISRPIAKRDAEEEMPSIEEVERFRRDVEANGGLNDESWWLEMLEKDQDDCTKRLFCEISAKGANNPNDIERSLTQLLGIGNRTVDVSKPTALFDMAAQSGRAGIETCRMFYKRCETEVADIVDMIQTELQEFEEIEKDFEKNQKTFDKEMKDEKEELAKEMKELGIIEDKFQIWN